MNSMDWIKLTEEGELQKIKEESTEHPVLIFKHSTRCSISSSVLNRLERGWDKEKLPNIKPYYLDLIAHRNISNCVANEFGIHHESPQALIIHKGQCIYHVSHMAITYSELCKQFECL